ncbi:helix-turn-helix transcriptional regulator [Agrobacterium vitis]|uniref:helix-turn-helix transcriptional regulator n=1 Tax=Agrobacterium vitis TaxID=373 RepID=UPI0012E82CEA|nr:hypothetical protein [Agrobacterium vitis]MCF1501214.1 hypothetical protein [Allorhizobium sp. Av2]MVA66678.1 hypothetical protein [Agrobacterium vitis]MVA87541.1 hypothetical protein [Agrobacterium vitis]
MSANSINLRIQPRRMLSKREACEYVGVSPRKFDGAVDVAPLRMPDGSVCWDMHDLDAWIDSLKSGTIGSADDIVARLG